MASILGELARYIESQETLRKHLRGKVFAGRAPQTRSGDIAVNFPFMVLNRIATEHDYHLGGEITPVRVSVQVDIYTRGFDAHLDLEEITEALRQKVSGFHHGTWGTTLIHSVVIERQNEFSERPMDGSDDWIYRRSLDLAIRHAQVEAPVA